MAKKRHISSHIDVIVDDTPCWNVAQCNVRRIASDTSCAWTVRLGGRTNRITCLKSPQSCPRNLLKRHGDETLDQIPRILMLMYVQWRARHRRRDSLYDERTLYAVLIFQYRVRGSIYDNVFQRRRSRTRPTDSIIFQTTDTWLWITRYLICLTKTVSVYQLLHAFLKKYLRRQTDSIKLENDVLDVIGRRNTSEFVRLLQ